MKVVIITAGSRGDTAPYIGLGTRLQAAGHDVALAAEGRFEEMIRDSGLAFRRMPGDTRTHIESVAGRDWQQRGFSPRGIRSAIQVLSSMVKNLDAGIVEAAAGADVLLLHRIAFDHGYLVAKAMGIPSVGLELFPSGYAPSVEQLPAGLGGRHGPRWLRRLLVAYNPIRQQHLYRLYKIGEFQKRLGLPPTSGRDVLRDMEATNWPIFHGYSPLISPRPSDWRPGLEVVGYWWPPRPSTWQPPATLVDFLESGPPPVFIGFGSMSPGDTERLSVLTVDALRRAGVRGVIQAGWAGMAANGDDVLAIDETPHDWLFPRMAAVVHHAGAGTTGAGLRAGVPAIAVPMLADQPYWGWRLTQVGVSPGSLPFKDLTADRLGTLIRQAVTEPGYRERASALGAAVRAEDGAGRVIDYLNRL